MLNLLNIQNDFVYFEKYFNQTIFSLNKNNFIYVSIEKIKKAKKLDFLIQLIKDNFKIRLQIKRQEAYRTY